MLTSLSNVRYCKAYPDEKGIETKALNRQEYGRSGHCKAYPDEKGIETTIPTVYNNIKSLKLQSLSR